MFHFPEITKNNIKKINVGDFVCVKGNPIKAKIEKIWYDESTAREVVELNWGEFGKSRVYMHDLNKTWTHINSNN